MSLTFSVVDFELLRKNMVMGQLQPNKIVHESLLEAFSTIPREEFCAPSNRGQCYSDSEIPVLFNRVLFPPMILAQLLQYLDPMPNDRCLIIGGSTGYSAAILSMCTQEVYLVESIENTSAEALEHLKQFHVQQQIGILENGLAQFAPYDLILIEGGSVSSIPPAFFNQLSSKGRIGAIIDKDGNGFGLISVFNNKGENTSPSPLDANISVLPDLWQQPDFKFI